MFEGDGFCIGNSMICSDIWHKYHEWYFKLVIRNFTSRLASEIWDNFEISRVVFTPNITHKIVLLFVYITTRKRFVILTCRCFKLSWNTTALSQSNCRNFSKLLEKAYSFSKWLVPPWSGHGPATVRPASSDFWKAPLVSKLYKHVNFISLTQRCFLKCSPRPSTMTNQFVICRNLKILRTSLVRHPRDSHKRECSEVKK